MNFPYCLHKNRLFTWNKKVFISLLHYYVAHKYLKQKYKLQIIKDKPPIFSIKHINTLCYYVIIGYINNIYTFSLLRLIKIKLWNTKH